MQISWSDDSLTWDVALLTWGATRTAPALVVLAPVPDERERERVTVVIEIDDMPIEGDYEYVAQAVADQATADLKMFSRMEQTDDAVRAKLRGANRRFAKRFEVISAQSSDPDVDEDLLIEEIKEDLQSVYSDAVMSTTERVH